MQIQGSTQEQFINHIIMMLIPTQNLFGLLTEALFCGYFFKNKKLALCFRLEFLHDQDLQHCLK